MKSKDYYLSKSQSAKNVGISSRLIHQKDLEGRSQTTKNTESWFWPIKRKLPTPWKSRSQLVTRPVLRESGFGYIQSATKSENPTQPGGSLQRDRRCRGDRWETLFLRASKMALSENTRVKLCWMKTHSAQHFYQWVKTCNNIKRAHGKNENGGSVRPARKKLLWSHAGYYFWGRCIEWFGPIVNA